MNKMLHKPGTSATQQYEVDLFPQSRPISGRVVAVWDQKGDYLGEYIGRRGKEKGTFLSNVRISHSIDSDSHPVYWAYATNWGPVDGISGPAFERVSPDQINPGDKIEMFEQWWNVRYINFYTGSRRFQLQREEDELHPLCDKTCMKVEFHDGLHVRIKRMLPARGGRDA